MTSSVSSAPASANADFQYRDLDYKTDSKTATAKMTVNGKVYVITITGVADETTAESQMKTEAVNVVAIAIAYGVGQEGSNTKSISKQGNALTVTKFGKKEGEKDRTKPIITLEKNPFVQRNTHIDAKIAKYTTDPTKLAIWMKKLDDLKINSNLFQNAISPNISVAQEEEVSKPPAAADAAVDDTAVDDTAVDDTAVDDAAVDDAD